MLSSTDSRAERVWALALCALAGCVHEADADSSKASKPAATALATSAQPTTAPVRAQLDGRAFPDGVLALTWDDGPDAHTLGLAQYLERERVSATFFVVAEWTSGVSSDPGFGEHVYESGHAKLPILADLMALGHRIGNHTLHHPLLSQLAPSSVDVELSDNQRAIDPFIRDEMRIFRVPGGDWNEAASRVVDGDAFLAPLEGPVRWDIDPKDWEGAAWCESEHPSIECEHVDGRYRVRPRVMATRYETAIEAARHGIVLLHDRVGDVGSEYALDVARLLVPRLIARGYVFAAPVLWFAPMRTRWSVATCDGLRLGDVDGDGRKDACVRDHDRVTCAMSKWHAAEPDLERVAFVPTYDELLLPPHAGSFELADVDGDGRADVCVAAGAGDIACAVANRTGWGAFESWSHDAWASPGELHFADLDGDGKADVCESTPSGVLCARSTGAAFEPARAWLPGSVSEFALGDVNADGRADICVPAPSQIECALSTRTSFGHLAQWSSDTSFTGALTLADLNGDGRVDVCRASVDGVSCALSNAHTFTKATTWLPGGTVTLDGSASVRAEWGRVGDINGDGRADICTCDGKGVRCAIAP